MKHNWIEEALKRWPNAQITGDGRWAIAVVGTNTGRTRQVVLCSDEATQRSAALFYDRCNRVDLLEPVFSGAELLAKIPDRYDADDARRERRERQRNA